MARAHLNGCVELEAAYCGAPPGWIGRRVNVQWDSMYVRLCVGMLIRSVERTVPEP
jgi:hypothetical protein